MRNWPKEYIMTGRLLLFTIVLYATGHPIIATILLLLGWHRKPLDMVKEALKDLEQERKV